MADMSLRRAGGDAFIHVPTPGDHYSMATGSAVPTIIYELSRQHGAHGGATRVVVGRGTRHDYGVGESVEVGFLGLPDTKRKAVDAALGRLGTARPFVRAVYRPALAAIPTGFAGRVFVYNAPGAISMFAGAAPHAHVCLYAQNSLFNTYSPAETRRVVESAGSVICCSQFIADELQRHIGSQDARIHAIVNGVDIERFIPTDRPHLNAIPLVLFVGRVLPVKGPDLLIRAAVKIHSAKRPFRLRIVGSSNFSADDDLSSYEQELRRLAAPLGDAVEFQPFVDRAHVLTEYRSADIFCAPSNWDEPCSLTVPEAIACGLPTIASRRGGIPEVGGDAVLYFDPPDVDALADRMAFLLDDASERDRLGKRARAQAETISWERQYALVRAATIR